MIILLTADKHGLLNSTLGNRRFPQFLLFDPFSMLQVESETGSAKDIFVADFETNYRNSRPEVFCKKTGLQTY